MLQQDDNLSAMSGRKILRRFSSSISDLLSIQKKSSIDECDNGTALHTAVQMGNAVMAKALLDSKSVWIDEEDGKGRTALHYSMEQNSTELASLLLRMKANVDCIDYNGTSACHLACQQGMIDAFNVLLYYHADVCAVDKLGKTPFDLACEFGQEKMVACILACGIEHSLIENSGNAHKASALHLAARNGHTNIVLILLLNGWNINRLTSTGSALHEAAGYGRAQTVRFLLHAGINTELTNASGQTALDFAKKNAYRNPITVKEIRFLLKEHKKFVYGEAVRDHLGVRADELSFSKGDLIWVVERGNTKEGRAKGIIFGQRANSRSGSFDPKAVKIVERPQSVIGNMSNRVSLGHMQTFGQPQERKAKKFDIPIVPKVVASNPSKAPSRLDVNRNVQNSCRSVHSPSRMSDDRDSQNGNRVGMNLNTFGTDAFLSFGKPAMTTLQNPSTSNLSLIESHRISTGSNCSQGSSGFESMKHGTSASSSASSFNTSQQTTGDRQGRTSIHSSGSAGSGPSSLASCSVDALDESFGSSSPYEPTIDVTQMVSRGVPEAEILAIWLDKLNMSEYLSLFLTQGYDLSTIARITPEDLSTVGVTNPDHRKMIMIEIHTWNITDSWPAVIPSGGLKSWLDALALPEYLDTFISQRYTTVQEVMTLAWEDLEDVGIKRLGHLKRILLASKKIKDSRLSMASTSVECTVGSSGMKFVQTPVQVHSPRSHARTLDYNRSEVTSPRINDPPPPAPSSFRGKPLSGGIDYFSYSRGTRANAPAPPVRKEDYAPYANNSSQNSRGIYENTYQQLPEPKKREPLKLNFYGNGQILSEAADRDNVSLMSSTLNLDFPPAPAPLAIDSSIRRLQDACASSSSIGSMSSTSSFEIPFANENCGTIRARDQSRQTSSTTTDGNSESNPAPTIRPPILKNSSTPRENVLNSIGTMLDSLTAELDGMLEPYNKKKVMQPT